MLFYPNRLLRFFPPSFSIRDPKTSLVKKAFKNGKQVVLILFHLKGVKTINGHVSDVKRSFEEAVREKLPDKMILSLFQNNREEMAIIVKINEEVDSLFNIEDYIEDIVFTVRQKMGIHLDFQIGYMVVEKDINNTREAIHRAYSRANAMAEKRLQSKYNDILYEIRKLLNQQT